VAARVGDVLGGENALLVMAYEIRCNEAWASFRPDAVGTDGQGSYYRDAALASARYWQQACALFPRAGKSADIGPAAVSRTPVLMINGSSDPQDPPSNMAGAKQRWPESLQLVEPHQSHDVSQWQCQEAVVDAFIERGTIDGLPTDCLATMQTPPFATS
jgi:pimeloyl-ACP methyl ester carboxylesterase